MKGRASGEFEVTLTPEEAGEAGIGRMSIDKKLVGDLEATSRGEMLTVSSATPGSAGYVAIERVTGVLAGRSGTFVLQHHGLMARGDGRLTVTVVPDSGTEELADISGTMTISIAPGGAHSYVFDYAIGEP